MRSSSAEQSLDECVDTETHVFQNQGLIHASPLNLIWDQILNSAEKNLIPAIPIQPKLMTLWGFAVIAGAKGKQDTD